MKNKCLKLLVIFAVILIAISLKTKVQANSISQISMDIYVDKFGNGNITEVWKCKTTEGTEVYHPYYNLGKSNITNLTVSESGKTYTTLSRWNTSGSLSSKAYKCGLNNIKNGVEICWGQSTHGSHTYTVKYTITNFVSELTDAQMIYWTLIPYDFSNTIGNVKIKIYADTKFVDTTDVWGYGKKGALCYVSNGAIYMDTDGSSLRKSEYMTILVKLEKGRFNTESVLYKDFDYYYEMAEDGSEPYQGSSASTSKASKIMGIIAGLFSLFFNFGIFVIVAIAAGISGSKKTYGFNYGPLKKTTKDATYYRDIPNNGDIFRSYYIAYQYELVKNKTDLLGAIILKWLKEGIISTEQKTKGTIFKKEDTVIVLGDERNRNFANSKEEKLFQMMYDASGDGILENKEFEKWCRKSYEKILGWFDEILKEQRDKLVAEGLITSEKKTFTTKYTATAELKEEALNLAGLKKFLLNYTLIKEREAIEVTIFEDYLIYAQMMGIAQKVAKQFKEIYPDMIEQSHFSSYDNLIYINYCATRGISSASSARAAAQSYSSGGGGFSSGGGGGGSFGGGGGRRRFPLIE